MVIDRLSLILRNVVLLVLCSAVAALSQVSTATVMGVVQDAAKASIPNAGVKLINTETGSENDSTTNAQGSFLLPGIMPGAYTLQIERKGFATTQVNGITLNLGDTKSLLIRMKVGAVTETITVDASGLTLNTVDASVSTVVDRHFVANIPLNGRSFQDLISMTPGIVTQNPQAATQNGSGTQGDFSVNGEQTNSNSFFVDGVTMNLNSGPASGQSRISSTGSIAGSTALGTTQSLVSVDTLQEFRVLSSTYSAEYGRTPGGQFTFLTRSGTNETHGSLYNYYRSKLIDASDWFSTSGGYPASGGTNVGVKYDPAYYDQNDFGGTLGAPIVFPGAYNGRDKSFMFLSYEGLYVDQQTPQTFSYTPSICNTASDGGETCNAAPYDVPNTMVPVLNTFPFPSSDELIPEGNLTGLALATIEGVSFPSHVNSASARLDHSFSPKFSIFVRYGNTSSNGRANQLWSVTDNQVNTQTVTFGATNQLSTTRNNEFRLGYARSNGSANTTTERLGSAGGGVSSIQPIGDLNAALGIPSSYGSASADAYIHIVGVGDTDSRTNQLTSSLQQWNIRDTFSLQAQNHLFKFGIDQRHVSTTLTPPSLSVLADFFDRTSMATNSASDIVVTKSTPASPILNEFSAFAEDQWRASKTLSLSLGLRWDVNPAPTGQHGLDAYTVLGDVTAPATLQLAPRGTPLWHTTWYDFAPRLGVAWAARNEPGKELIVRAGGGVFFDTGTQPALEAFTGIGFAASAHFLGAPVPVTPEQLNFSTAVAPPYANAKVFAFPSHLQLPYSFQWNIGVEKALGRSQSLTISYVGADGRRLLEEQRRNLNQSNPNFGDVFYFPSGVTSNYQSLQTKFQRSLSHGVEVLASYTWAHALDYGSTDPAYPLRYGNSDLDLRHNLEAAASWSSPNPKNRFFSFRRLLEGWGTDARLIARTGFPVNLAGNFFFDPITGDPYYSGPDLIPNRPLYLYGSAYPGKRIFNGGINAANPAFSLPSGMVQGNAPRNLLRGFGEVQGNIAIRQSYHLYGAMNMQFKVETFNVFNHPSFGYIDPHLSDLLFGQSTKMLDQSFGAAGALYDQGGPRVIQLSLKVVF
jgi:hypothetical protein